MKRNIFILLLILTIKINAETSPITGSWLMTKAEIAGKVDEPNYITIFKQNGTMEIMGMNVGTWKYNPNDEILMLNSKMDKDFNGECKVLELSKSKLIVNKDGATLYYSKIDSQKIAKDNNKSNIAGLWKIESKENTTTLIKFELPDNYSYIKAEDGMTEKTKGTWIYNSIEKTILFIGFLSDLEGNTNIQKISTDQLVLENKGKIIKAKRINTDKNKIERLVFEYEDIPEENNGEYSLPWTFEPMVNFLKNVKSIKFKYGKLIEDFNILKHTSDVVSIIKTDSDKQTIRFTNLSISAGDTSQFSENYKGGLTERYNDFFPKDELELYRIIGIADVKVSAGKFKCTVVEGFNDDKKCKYWMINDKPGIYAKIIVEDEDVFDKLDYSLFELEEIRYFQNP